MNAHSFETAGTISTARDGARSGRARIAAAAGALLLLSACAVDPDNGKAEGEFKSETKLGALLPAGAQLVGVTVSPEGKRYVLDRNSGLHEVSSARVTHVFRTSELATRYGQTTALDLTDVAALGSDRFAITAENDGFLLDIYGGTFNSYFCYFPDLAPSGPGPVAPITISQGLRAQGVPVKERTESVAFSRDSLQLFAQPQTIRMDNNKVVGSELFIFTQAGGEPIRALRLPDDFIAGGMVAVAGQTLLLGSHDKLYQLSPTGDLQLLHDFEAPIEITGMARDTDGDLLLLDSAGMRLLEVTGY